MPANSEKVSAGGLSERGRFLLDETVRMLALSYPPVGMEYDREYYELNETLVRICLFFVLGKGERFHEERPDIKTIIGKAAELFGDEAARKGVEQGLFSLQTKDTASPIATASKLGLLTLGSPMREFQRKLEEAVMRDPEMAAALAYLVWPE